MKLHLSFVCALLLVFPSCISFSAIQGFNWKITLRVVDQDGVPVEGATASVGYHLLTDGRGVQGTGDERLTNVSGEATFSNRSYMPIYLGARKEGYYESRFGTYDFETTRLRRWMPWNPTVEIELKEIRNPVPMYANYFSSGIPAEGEDIGFDLEKSDWVAPYGRGIRSDILFYMTRRGDEFSDFDMQVKVHFPNDGDGIQEVRVPHPSVSVLRLDHIAPPSGYQSSFVREAYQIPGKGRSGLGRDNERNFFFRVRTVTDDSGNVVSAKYGKIHGDIYINGWTAEQSGIHFLYYFNPDGSRNMEFDPERNLLREALRNRRGPPVLP